MSMIISMPDDEREKFLEAAQSIADQAEAYTVECVKILVEQHGAIPEEIERDIFLHNAVGRLIQGKELFPPRERVLEAIGTYKAKYLGLGWED